MQKNKRYTNKRIFRKGGAQFDDDTGYTASTRTATPQPATSREEPMIRRSPSDYFDDDTGYSASTSTASHHPAPSREEIAMPRRSPSDYFGDPYL